MTNFVSKKISVEELRTKIKELHSEISKALDILDLANKKNKVIALKQEMIAPDFWNDQDRAKTISLEASVLEGQIDVWQTLVKEVSELSEMSQDKQADELLIDIQNKYQSLDSQFKDLSQQLYLQGKHDHLPAIVTINAGAGGVDAQDWAQMVERMYLRLAEKNNWTLSYLSRSMGAEAGIKSATFKINGLYAYGYLKNEAGVHRLVRLSPYDGDHARHTSFAMLEVLPELLQTDMDIKDDDLKIDTFRSSGNGGQSVNTTDSAVRITHLPTGISTSCQNERSQLQNKKQALAYLYGKLQKYYEAEREEEKKLLKGEYTEAAWGNQIRSYVIHPYKMVKDHRTNFQSKDPDRVLDGDLMPFIRANLEKNVVA
ncbi:MAG: peptide chain release factor 2 [Patescibacteria group bacterium]